MPIHLVIVNRLHPDVCEDLRARFAGDTNVRVILDRRLGARRRRTAPAAAERRRAERRSRPDVDEKLRTASHTIVSEPSEASSLREVREWIEVLYDRVGAIRDALDGHDRLRREAETIAQAHERLRSEVDRARRELEDIDAAFTRALALANDLLSRLRSEASPSHTG
jgi:chromosome segregation ATPase